MQDTAYLTSLSINGEETSITFSEPRGSILPASATLLVDLLYSRNLTGDSRASTSTCFEPWHRPLRLSRMTDTLDRLRRRSRA
jgi:hypothetical protein